MRVEMFAPDRLYGFASDGESEVFFHAGAFVAGSWPGVAVSPPPIVGEEVLVGDVTEPGPDDERRPRARSVVRLHAPPEVEGVVESFGPDTGWGFVRGDDGESYYLHRSEVEEGRLPITGQRVSFFAGFKKGRRRACHVRVGTLDG